MEGKGIPIAEYLSMFFGFYFFGRGEAVFWGFVVISFYSEIFGRECY